MSKATPEDLLFVSKSPKERLDYLSAGESLANRTGYSIRQLRVKAALDRLQLAKIFLAEADALHVAGIALKRTAVSRAYYAMYHGLRAAVFIAHGGDDHEQHTVLPSKLPPDFPQAPRWQNSLKNARLERNRADYDPYPKKDEMFDQIASDLIADAKDLLGIVRRYIRSKS